MGVLVSTMTQKGQVTIPKDVREILHLVTGDKVEFLLNSHGEIVIKPVTRKVSEVAGILSKYKRRKSLTIEEMDNAVQQQFKNDIT
ncbi:AbrB/MazE/SpoVT family DNA-binding domain-containing protein [Leucothrix pacifica]|uniref:AbrB family transcriptional regulator n=1 Tax=Leucothrix pacifica TaxID=1247513 RepID=A0A317C7Y2_9GAMM|nr:AbrB/MazE/SpoVT family DNA-binding domain-containing protein [Leucothrix pacifica]PWQ92232.1 AbrB family transcriptional regulator [Leucothrix pacifica]